MKLIHSLPTIMFRSLCASALVGALLALTACSTVRSLDEIEHGLGVANRGDSRISNVVIQYGKIMRNECIPFCHPKSGGGVWNAPMPIPDTMQVTWETSDGQKREVTVPVKSRIKDRYRLRTLYLEFSGSQLSVRQALHGFEELPLFP